jgi:hypothetical protein
MPRALDLGAHVLNLGLFLQAKGVPSHCVLELDLGAIRILPADPEPSNYFEALQSLEEHDMSVWQP